MEPAKSEKLVEVSDHKIKTRQVDRHCVCAMSGIVGDARILIDHARVEAQNHRFNYAEPMTVEQITEAVSDLAINFGEGYEGQKRKPMARPYGVALLIAGVDERGPQLFQTDPSGTFLQWQARAIGSGGETAMTFIKEQYHANMTLVEAERLVLQALKNVMEEKITKENVEVSIVRTDTRMLENRTQAYIDSILGSLA